MILFQLIFLIIFLFDLSAVTTLYKCTQDYVFLTKLALTRGRSTGGGCNLLVSCWGGCIICYI